MYAPLDDWTEDYVKQIAATQEDFDVEKKASDKFDPENKKSGTQNELAKEVCAFANSSGGVLIYGVRNDGTFDGGVPEDGTVSGGRSRQTAKAWTEQNIPALLSPPLTAFQVRHIPISGHHALRYGVLVVEVPPSDRRPHWIIEHGREVAYIRAGEHSFPMRLQTFLDISSRTTASAGVIRSLGQFGSGELDHTRNHWLFRFNPIVELISGPPCELWSLNVQVDERGSFAVHGARNATIAEPNQVTIHGMRPLFPRVPTRACEITIELRSPTPPEARLSLSVGAAHPVVETLRFSP